MYLIWCYLLVIALKIAIHYINYNSSERRSVQHVCLRTSLQMRGSTSWARDKENKIWFPDKTRIHDLPDTGWKRKTQSHVTERLGKLTFRFSHLFTERSSEFVIFRYCLLSLYDPLFRVLNHGKQTGLLLQHALVLPVHLSVHSILHVHRAPSLVQLWWNGTGTTSRSPLSPRKQNH